jgi:hypothetical protein
MVRVETPVEVSIRDRMPSPLERCCRHHENWTVLRDHLAAAFPMLDKAVVCGEVERTRVAVERFGLHIAEGLDTAEALGPQRDDAAHQAAAEQLSTGSRDPRPARVETPLISAAVGATPVRMVTECGRGRSHRPRWPR